MNVPAAGQNPTIVYARDVATGKTTSIALVQNSRNFRLEGLPSSWHFIYSWTQTSIGYVGGSHSIEGTCGNLPSCERRCMTPVEIRSGQTASGIELVEWYDALIVPSP